MRSVVQRLLTLACLLLTVAGPMVGAAWAIDESEITATNKRVVPAEDAEFNAAMKVWNSHKYKQGAELLKEFSKKHPNSRWAAEADLHVGCGLVYGKQYSEARTIFESIIKKHPKGQMEVKARVRLGNICEATGNLDEGIRQYTEALKFQPTWGQYKYCNFAVRALAAKRNHKQAIVNCGPVALAACLKALGKTSEAEKARSITVGEDGISLGHLAAEAETLGVGAQAVEMTAQDLEKAKLPVLAHVRKNHFVAVTALADGKATLVDSVQGEYRLSFAELAEQWSGKALIFGAPGEWRSLASADALAAVGGCCAMTMGPNCLGSCPQTCQQTFTGPGGGSSGGPGGGGGGCDGCVAGGSPGRGRPTWKVNTNNLNLIVEDTPIWYSPGKGPQISFTLTYSNEASDFGIFGNGVRCQYDQKVFFLPSTYPNPPSLQVHLSDGNIETYEWNSTESAYVPAGSEIHYGYRNAISVLASAEYGIAAGSVKYSLMGGGALYFKGEGGASEGRITHIRDVAGNMVECQYKSTDPYDLEKIIDANGRETEITTTGSGFTERVTLVTLPDDTSYNDSRHAHFVYEDGNLTSITDMAGYTSYLTYGKYQAMASTSRLVADITPTSPANGQDLEVTDLSGAGPSYYIYVKGQDGEIIKYSNTETDGQGRHWLKDILRGQLGSTAAAAAADDPVTYIYAAATLPSAITSTSPADGQELAISSLDNILNDNAYIRVMNADGEIIRFTGRNFVGTRSLTNIRRGQLGTTPSAASGNCETPIAFISVPYLESISTPTQNTRFAYEWWSIDGATYHLTALHEVYEWGAAEQEPTETTMPTWHLAWCSGAGNIGCKVTRYPETITGTDPCTTHWTGGLTKKYYTGINGDILGSIVDEEDDTVVSYTYDATYRNKTTVTDGRDNETDYTYDTGNTNPLLRYNVLDTTDATLNKTRFTYYSDGKLKSTSKPSPVNALSTAIYTTLGPNDGGNLALSDASAFPSEGGILVHSSTGVPEVITYTGKNGNSLTGIDRGAFVTTMIGASAGTTVTGDFQLYEYNSAGQPTRTIGPYGVESSLFYSASDGTYKIKGALDYSLDGREKRTNYYYNESDEARGFLTSTEAMEGQTGHKTSYTYDDKGRRYQVTDPNSNTTTYLYDDLDRVTQVWDAGGTTVTTNYSCCGVNWSEDENARLQEGTWYVGRREYKLYDAKHRLQMDIKSAWTTKLADDITGGQSPYPADSGNLAVTDASHFPPTGGSVLIYKIVYNEDCKCVGKALEVVTYTGKSGNTLTGIDRGADSTSPSDAVEGDGVALIDARTNYGYHTYYFDWLTTVTDAMNNTTTYEYYNNHPLEKITYANSDWEDYTYDAAGNLTKKEYNGGKNMNYDYDANNRLFRTWGNKE